MLELQAICVGHVAAMQVAEAAAAALPDPTIPILGRDSLLFEAAANAAVVLPEAADAALLAPLEAALEQLPEVSVVLCSASGANCWPECEVLPTFCRPTPTFTHAPGGWTACWTWQLGCSKGSFQWRWPAEASQPQCWLQPSACWL